MFKNLQRRSRLVTASLILISFFILITDTGFCWTPPKVEKPANFQDYPKKPIEFVCSWGVGGGADVHSRKVAELVKKYYDINMVVVNMPGAAGAKGINYAMTQPADGYTIFFAGWDVITNPLLKKNEFGPEQVQVIQRGMYVPGAYWVLKDSRFKTWQEVVDYSKKNPYKLLLADVGRGGIGDFILALWAKCKGVKITYVPYDEPSRRYASFAGGHADIMYEEPGDIKHLIDQGARPLVFMSSERLPEYPNTPTAKELGCDITMALWRGIGINKKVAPEIKDYLSKVIGGACQSPEFQNFLKMMVADPRGVLWGEKAHTFYLKIYDEVKTAYDELKGK